MVMAISVRHRPQMTEVQAMQGSFGKLRQLEHHIDDSIRMYHNVEPDDYPAHWHNAAELIVPVDNEYTVMVGEKSYTACPGEVLLIPVGVVHEIFAPEWGQRYIFMIDQKEFYAIDGLSQLQYLLYPCVHLRTDNAGAALDEIFTYVHHAVEDYARKGPLTSASAKLWLRLALVRIVDHLMSQAAVERPEAGSHQHQQIAAMMDVCAYISEHCAEKLTLDNVAAYSGYSKYHFARVFKLYAGMGFYDYYMRQRMVLCRRLLSDLGLRVTDVALRAGFDSIATFNRVFKQYEGVTPSRYRRMQQNLRRDDPAPKERRAEAAQAQ